MAAQKKLSGGSLAIIARQIVLATKFGMPMNNAGIKKGLCEASFRGAAYRKDRRHLGLRFLPGRALAGSKSGVSPDPGRCPKWIWATTLFPLGKGLSHW